MLSDTQKQMLGIAINGVKMKRAQAKQQDMQMRHERGKAVLDQRAKVGTKGSTASKSKGSTGSSGGASADTGITPYLGSTDLMETSNAVAAAEQTDSAAKFGMASAAADALRASGDIERSTRKNVAGANADAAARGIYDSGIREGNVDQALIGGQRAMGDVRTQLALAATQAIAQRNQARQTLGTQLGIMTQRAAENGMALPVDPYAASPSRGTNTPGVRTARKTTTRRKPAGAALRPSGRGRAVL